MGQSEEYSFCCSRIQHLLGLRIHPNGEVNGSRLVLTVLVLNHPLANNDGHCQARSNTNTSNNLIPDPFSSISAYAKEHKEARPNSSQGRATDEPGVEDASDCDPNATGNLSESFKDNMSVKGRRKTMLALIFMYNEK